MATPTKTVCTQQRAPGRSPTEPLDEHQDCRGGIRVFRSFSWLRVVSVKTALACPTLQRLSFAPAGRRSGVLREHQPWGAGPTTGSKIARSMIGESDSRIPNTSTAWQLWYGDMFDRDSPQHCKPTARISFGGFTKYGSITERGAGG